MAQKKIELVFDLDANDVKIASEATLTLAQQVRVLKQELQKTQEGTKEFEILRNKLNETKDNFERVNVKSRELFGTLSLIPGPIGEIAGKLNGAISLLKTFSGFSIKDIQQQFKGFVEDIKGVLRGFGILSDTTKELTDSEEDLKNASKSTTEEFQAQGTQLQQNLQLQNSSITTLQKKIQSEQLYQQTLNASIAAEQQTIDTAGENIEQKIESIEKQKNLNRELELSKGYQSAYERELSTVTNQTKAQTEATKALTISQRVAQGASQALAISVQAVKAAFISLGIGALVVLVVSLAQAIGNLFTATEELTEAEKLNNQVNEKSAEIASKQISVLEQLDAQIKKSTLTDRQKDEAVKQYNTTLGETLGKVENWIELEKKLIGKLPEYKQYLMKRAEAEATSLLITAAIQDKIKTEMSDPAKMASFYDVWSRGGILGFFIEGRKGTGEAIQKEAVGKFDKTISSLQNRLLETQDEIAKKQKELGLTQPEPKEPKKEDKKGKTPEQIAQEKLDAKKKELDAEIELEIRSETTREDKLKELLDRRYALEVDNTKKTEEEKKVIRQDYDKKLSEAIQEDFERNRQERLKNVDAELKIIESAGSQDIEKLKETLKKKRDIELEEIGLTEKEKEAIQAEYNKKFDDIDKQQRQERLLRRLDEAKNDKDQQIQIYQELLDELKTMDQMNLEERFNLQNEYQDKILGLIDAKQEERLAKAEEGNAQFLQYDSNYYDGLRTAYAQYQSDLDAAKEKGQITDDEYQSRKRANSKATIELDRAERESKLELAGVVGNALGAVADLVGRNTVAGKALSIAQATIDTYAGASKALATYPPPFGAIAAGTVILQGLLNVKKILSVKVPGASDSTGQPVPQGPQTAGGPINVTAQRRARGGMVEGPGSEDSDSIPAYLSNGEFVVNARSTRLFQPLLRAMNDFGNAPAFAGGGLAMAANIRQNNNNPSSSLSDVISETLSNTPIRTYVSSTEISNNQQFDRVIKSRSLI